MEMTGTSKRSAKSKLGGHSTEAAVAAAFKAYPRPIRTRLLALRRLILDTAKTTQGVGRIEEALKWGQPSYLTPETKSGSTVRIDHVAGKQYAVYFHCQTDLVATFREHYPDKWRYDGNRCILLSADDKVDERALRHCIALALTYHLNKRKPRMAAAPRARRISP
jgi:Domain of unknown function (DU1801)